MTGMVRMAEWQKEWQNGKMAEMDTYVMAEWRNGGTAERMAE